MQFGTKSLQTQVANATGAEPGSTDIFVYVPAVHVDLVTQVKKCTLAQLLSGAGLAIADKQVPYGTGTGLTSEAGFEYDAASNTLSVPTVKAAYKSSDGTAGVTFAGASITTLSVKDGIVVGHT